MGTDPGRIVAEASRLLGDQAAYAAMSRVANPYGDGKAARRIAQALLHWAGLARRDLLITRSRRMKTGVAKAQGIKYNVSRWEGRTPPVPGTGLPCGARSSSLAGARQDEEAAR